MVINIKKSKSRKVIDIFFTVLGWLFLIIFLYNLIQYFDPSINFTFYSVNLANANAIILFTVQVVLASSGLLLGWSLFNKRKYGGLKRRRFSQPVKTEEIADFFQLKEEEIATIQNARYVERN